MRPDAVDRVAIARIAFFLCVAAGFVGRQLPLRPTSTDTHEPVRRRLSLISSGLFAALPRPPTRPPSPSTSAACLCRVAAPLPTASRSACRSPPPICMGGHGGLITHYTFCPTPAPARQPERALHPAGPCSPSVWPAHPACKALQSPRGLPHLAVSASDDAARLLQASSSGRSLDLPWHHIACPSKGHAGCFLPL